MPPAETRGEENGPSSPRHETVHNAHGRQWGLPKDRLNALEPTWHSNVPFAVVQVQYLLPVSAGRSSSNWNPPIIEDIVPEFEVGEENISLRKRQLQAYAVGPTRKVPRPAKIGARTCSSLMLEPGPHRSSELRRGWAESREPSRHPSVGFPKLSRRVSPGCAYPASPLPGGPRRSWLNGPNSNHVRALHGFAERPNSPGRRE